MGIVSGELARFRDGRVERLGPQNGLMESHLYELAEGRHGEYYAASQEGIFVYDPSRPGPAAPCLG